MADKKLTPEEQLAVANRIVEEEREKREKLETQITELLAMLKSAQGSDGVLSIKVRDRSKKDAKGNSPKGVISVFGINKQHPVSLYASQWVKVMDPEFVTRMMNYIIANRDVNDPTHPAYMDEDQRDVTVATAKRILAAVGTSDDANATTEDAGKEQAA